MSNNTDMRGKVLDVDFKRKRRRSPRRFQPDGSIRRRRDPKRLQPAGSIRRRGNPQRLQPQPAESVQRQTIPGDFILIALVILIVSFGMVMVFSSSYYSASLDESIGNNPFYYLMRQAVFACFGFLTMLVLSRLDYNILGRKPVPQAVLALTFAGLAYVIWKGDAWNNASRWIDIGITTLMPGEIAKPALILFVSAYLARDPGRVYTLKGLASIMAVACAAALLIILQPNFSTALSNLGIVMGLLFIGGARKRDLALITGGGIAVGAFYLMSKPADYLMKRIGSFTDPFADSTGDGYQVVQGLLALGSGGLSGKFLGQSVQKKLYLPEQMNDFILAIIGEELGYIGIALLLAVYMLIVWRCVLITINAPDRFGMLLAGGITFMLGLQVALNMMVVLSIIPATGIALPFISYGGNALLIFMASMGVMISISRRSHPANESVS